MHSKVVATTALFVASDLQRAVDFYCDKLGFRDPGIWGEPPWFAMINRDCFDLMLSLAETPAQIRPNGPNRLWDLYIKVRDIRAELSALQAAGVTPDCGPRETEYGMIEVEIVDPDGYRICLGQDIG